jgi:hypothetical protein
MTDIEPSTTTDVAIQETKSVSLDLYADLERQEKFLADTIKEWTAQLEEVRKKIQDVMDAAGADEATIAGRPAFTWHRINKFRSKDFIKDRPNLAQQYIEPKVVDVFNDQRLKKDNPELYAEYQSRQFKRV